jgi:mono/diheme cytochrome c family protein
MLRFTLLLSSGLLLLTLAGTAAAVTTPEAPRTPAGIEQVLDSRCGGCHTRERVDAARARGEAILPITQRMEGLGARLTSEERATIMTFWGSPHKTTPPSPATANSSTQAAEAVIKSRCLQCHTRERIDQAIAAQLPFATMEAIMLKRGVVLEEKESQVLKIFWGSPTVK